MATTEIAKGSKSSEDEILKTAISRFQFCVDYENTVRTKQLDDLKFRAGQHWPDNIKTTREQDHRPCLTINRFPQFIRSVTNELRQNRPQIKIDAVDESTIEDAEIKEGMIRHIQVASNADIAYDTAVDNQVTMGLGYLRLITDYCDPKSFEQDIKIKRVKNRFSVYFPPCNEPDYSDAPFAFVTEDVDVEQFKREMKDQIDSGSFELAGEGDTPANWGSAKTIRRVEYFEVVKTADTLYMFDDGKIFLKSEMPEGVTIKNGQILDADGETVIATVKAERPTERRKVIWRKMVHNKVLEENVWPGSYIPIVPVLGDDLDIDGERDIIGMVRDGKDPARMLDYWTTAQTEAIALAPKAPFVIAEGQLTGYEQFWKTANKRNWSYLPYKPTTIQGKLAPPPQRQQAEPAVQTMIQAIGMANDNLKNTTGVYDPSLGDQGREVSGRAIMAQQRQGNTSNYHFGDNLGRAMRFLGMQIMELLPIIYDTARQVRILHYDGTSKLVKINQPTGKKRPDGTEQIFDMKKGKYDVVVDVGPSYMTQRQENAANLTQIAQAWPDLMNKAGDLVMKELPGAAMQKIAERLKSQIPGALEDEETDIPPELKPKIAQMQQMIDQLTGALNEAHDDIAGKKSELESKERIATNSDMVKLVIEAMKQETAANQVLLREELKLLSSQLAGLQQNSVDPQPQNDMINPSSGPMGTGQ